MNIMQLFGCSLSVLSLAILPFTQLSAQATGSDFDRIAIALMGATPLESDLHELSDRIGGRDQSYHDRVEAAFRKLAKDEPERVKLVDAAGSADDVTRRLIDAIADLLP